MDKATKGEGKVRQDRNVGGQKKKARETYKVRIMRLILMQVSRTLQKSKKQNMGSDRLEIPVKRKQEVSVKWCFGK